MFRIVLVEPQIPPNTGNIIRLAANTGSELHLVEPLGFNFDDKHMRRAGLDYHEYAKVKRHADWSSFLQAENPKTDRLFTLTTKGVSSLYEQQFSEGDCFVFGCETRGLSDGIRSQFPPSHQLRLPMLPQQRSLNLSNSVAICIYEAWRQVEFVGA